jgi:hypothetical protein
VSISWTVLASIVYQTYDDRSAIASRGHNLISTNDIPSGIEKGAHAQLISEYDGVTKLFATCNYSQDMTLQCAVSGHDVSRPYRAALINNSPLVSVSFEMPYLR